MMEIYKQFSFDAAHFLPHVPEGHKCRQLHGHTYQLTVFVKGMLSEPEGWILDYSDLKAVVAPVIDQLDHRLLNEVKGLENPTAEKLVLWLWQRLQPSLPGLSRLELKETPSSGVSYCGE